MLVLLPSGDSDVLRSRSRGVCWTKNCLSSWDDVTG